MYETHEAHYTVPNSHYLPHHSTAASPSLTASANILNYHDPSSPMASNGEQQIHTGEQFSEYKREPGTPTNAAPLEYPSYPSAFTPSPSLSGSESPRTPNSYNYPPSVSASVYPPTSLETGTERLSVPFPAPTPPLSATHLAKEHSIPDTEVKFSNEQIDCICDTLQQRKDMNTLGE